MCWTLPSYKSILISYLFERSSGFKTYHSLLFLATPKTLKLKSTLVRSLVLIKPKIFSFVCYMYIYLATRWASLIVGSQLFDSLTLSGTYAWSTLIETTLHVSCLLFSLFCCLHVKYSTFPINNSKTLICSCN